MGEYKLPQMVVEAAKSAAYGMVKYGAQVFPDMQFTTCMKMCKGGVLRIWIEDKRGTLVGDPIDIDGNM